jgi:glutaminyl-peptide cyclotransferase
MHNQLINNKLTHSLVVVLIAFVSIVSCTKEVQSGRFAFNKGTSTVPTFSADSAYVFIEQQVALGPRNPGSAGHQAGRNLLIEKLRTYAGRSSVFAQNFDFEGYEGEQFRLSNIIAAFNPTSRDRILLAAHWDTRPRAEEEQDNNLVHEPILGADDGGSGVAILLELARIMSEKTPSIGVDILLFDGEDYGHKTDLDYYFLGARYWSANPPVPGYNPRFGILLDMVGAKGATFLKEGFSMRYAPKLVENVWNVAAELGYQKYFIDQRGGPVADDHMIVNQVAQIPMINIINYRSSDGQTVEFAPHWHTHSDSMDIIDKLTLQAVGDVLVEIIYNRLN